MTEGDWASAMFNYVNIRTVITSVKLFSCFLSTHSIDSVNTIKIGRVMGLLWKITGGRPMVYCHEMFFDDVGGQSVKLFLDRLGRYWMATNKWALFRVEKRDPLDLLTNQYVYRSQIPEG